MKNVKIVKNGFSIVELMIVVIIIGIVAGTAIPSIEAMMQNRTQTVTRDMLVGAIQTAKREAVRRSRPVLLCASTNGIACDLTWNNADQQVNAGWIVFVDENRSDLLDNGDRIVTSQPNIRSQSVSTCAANSTLNPNGMIAFQSFGLTNNVRFLIDSGFNGANTPDIYDVILGLGATGRINNNFDDNTCAANAL